MSSEHTDKGVQAVITSTIDDVRILGREAGLLQSDGTHPAVITLTALLLLKERLIAYHEAGRMPANQFAPKAKKSLTV